MNNTFWYGLLLGLSCNNVDIGKSFRNAEKRHPYVVRVIFILIVACIVAASVRYASVLMESHTNNLRNQSMIMENIEE